MDDWGMETTESIVITDGEAECLANVPRQLMIKD
jgi:ectoine hydrolase